ncbi:MAG TPA: S-methyl-5-thioribose-1-phosphate isomerase [Cyclobacteriaceae bacterium]|nr:S-methyl-5-thioribose-1-phosphate isomerase [Cyclobacteriaceae bacterium]
MLVNNRHYETIWLKENNPEIVQAIDQRFLPFELVIEDIRTPEQMFSAIRDMHVRGAPLIGAAGALGMYLATIGRKTNAGYYADMASFLNSSRPTAVNLGFAVNRTLQAIIRGNTPEEKKKNALEEALKIIDAERENCRQIGLHGLTLIRKLSESKNNATVNILTHCNAGWLACIDYGTATAPIYFAHDLGIKLHVWVDETRPRNQGARLTAWELEQHGVPHTIIADNTGGHLMQAKMVDMVIVGSDRTAINGDVANKIGTYLKALAAFDNRIPFYVALPSSSIDWQLTNGLEQIPIEQRNADEIMKMEGLYNGSIISIDITSGKSPAANYAFDVTPSRLVTGLITERGICKARKEEILGLFPEKKPG